MSYSLKKSCILASSLCFIQILNAQADNTQILADCKSFAKLFRNTCANQDTPAASIAALTGSTVSCPDNEICPVGSNTSPPACAWVRKLCVTCQIENNRVFIRYQSNGLPDHCYGGKPNVTSGIYDIKMIYDSPLEQIPTKNFTSQDNYDKETCSPGRAGQMNIPRAVNYSMVANDTNTAKFMDGIAGFALNGVPIFTASSAEKTDPYYPKNWAGSSTGKVEIVDACVGHPQESGLYHYHMLPPCLVNAANLQTSKVCERVSSCINDVKQYALDAYTATSKKITYLGLAKDGRAIIGPYAADGNLISCGDLDQCGGMKLDGGKYVYVYLNTYPYAIGCFGPGQSQKYAPSCSTNTCSSLKSQAKSVYQLISFGLIAVIAFINIIY